jgi:hypothetical protein
VTQRLEVVALDRGATHDFGNQVLCSYEPAPRCRRAS